VGSFSEIQVEPTQAEREEHSSYVDPQLEVYPSNPSSRDSSNFWNWFQKNNPNKVVFYLEIRLIYMLLTIPN
jgi:hypothetical protein